MQLQTKGWSARYSVFEMLIWLYNYSWSPIIDKTRNYRITVVNCLDEKGIETYMQSIHIDLQPKS